MEVTAQLKHLQTSARKVRLATQFIKGLDVSVARQQLMFSPRASARPVLKLLNSAIANAEKNFELDKENLYIKSVLINEGTTLKRYMSRAFGRAAVIRKRASHIILVLAEKKPSPAKKKSTKPAAEKKPAAEPVISYKDLARTQTDRKDNKPKFEEIKKERKPFINIKEIKDKFIRRSGEG